MNHPRRLLLAFLLVAPLRSASPADWALDATALTGAARILGARVGARSEAYAQSPQSPTPAPGSITRGFVALGPAGSRGEVDGPFWRGNGGYAVLRNDPAGLEVAFKTGYVDGLLRFVLDIHGETWLGFKGTIFDPRRNKTYKLDNWTTIRHVYDARRDRGTFSWVENGKAKSESYSHGASGKEMVIELAGGWQHVFRRKS